VAFRWSDIAGALSTSVLVAISGSAFAASEPESVASVAADGDREPRSDPFFGEALYFAHQEQWFEALERLDAEMAQHYRVDEPELDRLFPFRGSAEFSVGDFELHYRMHHRAGRAIRRVLEANVPDEVRNEATYRLARIHFHKDQPRDALAALDGMRGEMSDRVRSDAAFLRANLYLAIDEPEKAVETLEALQSEDDLHGFAAYNLGIALLRAGRDAEAVAQLDRAGRVRGNDESLLAIRDKSNLVLGTLRFDAEQFDGAQSALDRVRLDGPFSNQALLRAGWADLRGENHRRALVPWSRLAERASTDIAVQEAWLALPYAYSKLGVHGRAAVLYGEAVESYSRELEKIDASIGTIRDGSFLAALVREEIRSDADWVIRLRSLPNAPETFYLMTLMASHDFQTGLQNYLDLEDLRRKLEHGQRSLRAFDDLIAHRRDYYAPLLDPTDQRFRELDARMRLRLEQRRNIAERLEQLLVAPRAELLATADEQALESRIGALLRALDGRSDAGADLARRRAERLLGAIRWKQHTDYDERLTDAHRHQRELAVDIEALEAQYASFVRTRQAATHGFVGYDDAIRGLRGRITGALEQIENLMERQGRALETVSIRELVARRQLVETYQNRARFAFADSYDRASKAQAEQRIEREADERAATSAGARDAASAPAAPAPSDAADAGTPSEAGDAR